MSTSKERAALALGSISKEFKAADIDEHLRPKPDRPLPPAIRPTKRISLKALSSYWRILARQCGVEDTDKTQLADEATCTALGSYENNIEACIGTLKLPVGIAGPLRINGRRWLLPSLVELILC